MSKVRPVRRSRGPGTPSPIAPTSSASTASIAVSSSWTSASSECVGVMRSWRRTTSPSRVTTPARIFVPRDRRRSHALRLRSCGVGTVTSSMAASGEKPYRVYRGGRQKGKVPLPGRDEARRQKQQRGGPQGPQRNVRRRPQREFSRGRAFMWSLVAVVLVLVLWAVAGYFVVRGGVSDANKRLQSASPGIGAVLKPTG